MPSGGITIFFVETAVRVSRTRQNITAIAPAMELTIERIRGTEKAMLAGAKMTIVANLVTSQFYVSGSMMEVNRFPHASLLATYSVAGTGRRQG